MKKNRTPSFLRPARHAPRTSLRAVHWIKLLILLLFACQFDSRAASVTLLWDPNPELDKALYRLYVGILSIKAGNPPLMGFPTEKTIYTVEGLDYLRTYYFVVTAENNDHLESGYSNEVIVQLALPTPTPTPNPKSDPQKAQALEVNYPVRSRGPSFETDENGFACLHGGAAKLATATLFIGLSLGAAEADQAGGQFGFPYPNFTALQVTTQTDKEATLYFDNLEEFSIPAAIDTSGMK